jgi:SAM-dependent methyltransferase
MRLPRVCLQRMHARTDHSADPAQSSEASTPCPLCSQRSCAPWLTIPCDWRRPDVPESYALRWCNACEFGFVAPRPTPAQVGAFYDFPEYYTHTAGKGDAKPAKQPLTLSEKLRVKLAWTFDKGRVLYPTTEMMLQDVSKQSGSKPRVLDLGCGSGSALMKLRDAGCEVAGIEPDARAAEACREKGLNVHAGTGEDIPAALQASRFDLVMMHHAMEHCIDPLRVAHNVAGLLAPQGVFLCEVPNNHAYGLRALCGPAWHWLDVPRHLNFFTQASMEKLMAAAGLRVLRTQHYGFTRQVDPAWLRTERRITERLNAKAGKNVRPDGGDSTGAYAWKLALRGLTLSDEKKYDSLRCYAKKA